MIFYKQMTKEQVIKWWEDMDNRPTKNEDISKEKKSDLLQDETVYAVMPKFGFGGESIKEFEDFLYTLSSDFKRHNLSDNASEYMKQYNHWLLYAIHIVKAGENSKKSEWIVIDQDKLTFIEKIWGHKFLNQRFMTPQDDGKSDRKGKKNEKPKNRSN